MLSRLLHSIGWTWVGVLSSDDDSGNEETQLLTQYLSMKGICIAYIIKIKADFMRVTEKIVTHSIEILRTSSAQVIILCGTYSSFMADLLKDLSNLLSEKTFVFGPIFASKIFLMEHYRKTFAGSLAVELYDLPVPDMTRFYDSFQVVNHPQDMLLEHIWLANLQCAGSSEINNRFYSRIYKLSLHNCSRTKCVTEFYSFKCPGLTDRIYEAVYSLAHALHNMYLSPDRQSQDKITRVLNYPHQVSNDFIK